MGEKSMSEARRRLGELVGRAAATAQTAKSATSAATVRIVAAAKAAAAQAAADIDDAAQASTTHVATPLTALDVTSAAAVPASSDPPEPDERDEIIARLEQELESERATTAELERAVKALEFQLDVLERSYGKQLADARADGDAAKEKLTAVAAQLQETDLELRRVTAVRDRLRDMFAFDGRRIPPELRERHPGDEDTIARLLSAAPLLPEPADDSGSSSSLGPGKAEGVAETETGELLSPELVFDPNEDRDD